MNERLAGNQSWQVVDTGIHSAAHNMECDTRLLETLDPLSTTPILHLYEWESPSTTYGHFIRPENHFSQEFLHSRKFQLAQRPTGGGVIFHYSDWAFSVLVPAGHSAYSVNTLDNYAFVNRLVIELIQAFLGTTPSLDLLPQEIAPRDPESRHFCMAKPTKYDVMWEGKKICGGAQRRTKKGFLHQGTLSLIMPDEKLVKQALLAGVKVYEAMVQNTFPLLGHRATQKDVQEVRRSLSLAFQNLVQKV